MTTSSKEQEDFDVMDARLQTMLPELYQDCYDDVQPVSMGSAGLKFRADGKVAWDEIWGSFCDLAMAGGPPHRGSLLEPGRREEIDAQKDRYREVVGEICRGVGMVTGLYAEASPLAGWVRMYCTSAAMAGWLARAIVMENVSASCDGLALYLPAGPAYRVEKEIKNVVTTVAKTCHYWLEHTSYDQHQAIADLLRAMESESPLIQPLLGNDGFAEVPRRMHAGKIAESIQQKTGLQPSAHEYEGWLGLECKDIHAAIWVMRVLVVSNVLARREGSVVFVPLNPISDPDGATVLRVVARSFRLAVARNIFDPLAIPAI